MKAPLFSVVIPWHGNPDHLKRALASIADQTFQDFEVVVAANGPAATKAEVGTAIAGDVGFGSAIDIRFVTLTEGDASRGRNAGADAAKGEFIAFLDVDDRFLPNKLQLFAEAIASDLGDLLWSRGYRVRTGQDRAIYPPQLFHSGENVGEFFFTRGANYTGSAIVVRREFATSVRFADDLKTYEDNDFAIRVQAAGARLHMLPEPLYEWFDEADVGRLSSNREFDKHLAWANSARDVLTDRAYYAFRARRYGQHIFPRRFATGLSSILDGWLKGGISISETTQFLVRGFLPRPFVRWIITRKAMRDAQVTRDDLTST